MYGHVVLTGENDSDEILTPRRQRRAGVEQVLPDRIGVGLPQCARRLTGFGFIFNALDGAPLPTLRIKKRLKAVIGVRYRLRCHVLRLRRGPCDQR